MSSLLVVAPGGTVSVAGEDAGSCTCTVHINNNGLEGATYTVSISQIRGG